LVDATGGVTFRALGMIGGAASAKTLVNRPGGQPGTSNNSATLVKSRSWNGT
jgi:hypothetical protein